MGQRYSDISEKFHKFIKEQKLFFVATAMSQGRVNVSPKGMDALRIISKARVVWLNLTGSGNETAAHVQHNPRMTLMFCAFTGPPMILRLYGNAKVIHKNDPEWFELFQLFEPIPGARQIFDLNVDLVQTSCGMGVPYYQYAGDREQLRNWAEKKGKAGLEQYWAEKNPVSLDGMPTRIMEKNTSP
jgi:hypothetical protein